MHLGLVLSSRTLPESLLSEDDVSKRYIVCNTGGYHVLILSVICYSRYIFFH